MHKIIKRTGSLKPGKQLRDDNQRMEYDDKNVAPEKKSKKKGRISVKKQTKASTDVASSLEVTWRLGTNYC